MAALPIQSIVEAGLLPVFSGAAGVGDTIANSSDERTFLYVKNGSGGSINVTATAVKTSAKVAGFGQLPRADRIVAVPAGEDRIIGPFPEAFNSTAGLVAINYSGVTSVTVAALRLPK